MWIMVVILSFVPFYMIPCFSNAATALLPSSRAFLTSFSPRAFSSALVKASVAASAGITQTRNSKIAEMEVDVGDMVVTGSKTVKVEVKE